MKNAFRLLSNFHLPERWDWAGDSWEHSFTPEFTLSQLRDADLIVVNGNIDVITKLVLAALLPHGRKPIVVVDLVLRRPRNTHKARLLRALLDRVDYFIHYFRDLRGYQQFYRIGPERSGYVPFKPNLRDHYEPRQCPGEYVLCLGESMRDYDTFFRAMAGLPFPGAISNRTAEFLREHCSKTVCPPPANIRLLDDDFSRDALIKIIEGARIVALPVSPDNICASGLSMYLNSMFLGKAVVITQGPGVSDVLTDEAIMVLPGDPGALREAIMRLWNDEQLRSEVAERGRLYAESLGGEAELHARLRDAAMNWYYQQHRTGANRGELVRRTGRPSPKVRS